MNSLCILLIEDNLIETLKFQRVIKELFEGTLKSRATYSLIIAKNGEEALSILQDKKREISVIFLDLNMPRMNGLEFLSIFKKNNSFKEIPVMILTSSKNIKDVKDAYKIGTAGYITKPMHYKEFKAQLNTVIQYWLINELYRE